MNNKNGYIEDETELDQADINQLSRPGVPEEDQDKEPQPVEGHTAGYLIGPPVGARFPRKEWQALLRLKKLYGFDSFPDTLRMAVLDALAYQEGEQHEGGEDTFAERLDQLSAKVDALTMSPTEETQEPEEEPQEEASPYNPETIAHFQNLDSNGKVYLAKALKANPNERHLGRYPVWQQKIDALVDKVTPHDGYRRHTPATRQARAALHEYLVEVGILPK